MFNMLCIQTRFKVGHRNVHQSFSFALPAAPGSRPAMMRVKLLHGATKYINSARTAPGLSASRRQPSGASRDGQLKCAHSAFSTCLSTTIKAEMPMIATATAGFSAVTGLVIAVVQIVAFKYFSGQSDDIVDPELEQLIARSPRLAGEPLPMPRIDNRFAKVEAHTTFSSSQDDPYRTNVKPPPAEFLKTKRDVGGITKRVLPVDGLRLERGKYVGHADKTWAWSFENVFDQEQCRELIEMANEKGFVTALVGNGWKYPEGDPRKFDELTYDPKSRDSYIAMFDCPELSEWLYDVLEPYLIDAPIPDGWHLDHLSLIHI